MDMRIRQLGAMLVFCLAAVAQTQTLTLDELLKFLTSSMELKMTDNELAKFLVKTKLSERLDDVTIEKLLAGGIGPKTVAALRLLRDQSESLATAKPVAAAPKPKLPPDPNAEEQAAIIEEVREYALNYSKNLPNFLSTQVVRRYQAGAPGSRYNRSSEPSWVQVDLLTLRLSYFDQKEEYKLIMRNNSPTQEDFKSVGGATSTGEFGSLLRDIFEARTHARFGWGGWARLGRLGDRQLVMAFSYSVEQANSQWGIEYERKEHIVPAYSGRILIDKDSHMVMRVTLNADNIPATFPVKMATTVLDYDYVDISGHPFLLPLKSETQMSADGVLSKNDTEFRLYRKYSAEAEIKYDITPDALPADQTKETPAAAPKTAAPQAIDCKNPKNAKDPACKKK
jgi:hypothetical protein